MRVTASQTVARVYDGLIANHLRKVETPFTLVLDEPPMIANKMQR